ncbi:unnamed protein product, partial [Owenia fusiformis]
LNWCGDLGQPWPAQFWDCWPYGHCTITPLTCTDWESHECRIEYCRENNHEGFSPLICTKDIMNGNNGRKKRRIHFDSDIIATRNDTSNQNSDLEMSFCLRPVLELMSLLSKYS